MVDGRVEEPKQLRLSGWGTYEIEGELWREAVLKLELSPAEGVLEV